MNESKDVSLDAMHAYPDWQAERQYTGGVGTMSSLLFG